MDGYETLEDLADNLGLAVRDGHLCGHGPGVAARRSPRERQESEARDRLVENYYEQMFGERKPKPTLEEQRVALRAELLEYARSKQ